MRVNSLRSVIAVQLNASQRSCVDVGINMCVGSEV